MRAQVRLWRAGILAMLLLPALLAPLQAADFQVGMQAYERGDYAAAIREWTPLAQRGDVNAQYHLGVLQAQDETGYAEARKWFRRAAEQGYSKAQFNLGLMHVNGLGGPKDSIQGYPWVALAAGQGLEVAAELKEVLEHRMTADQLSRALDLLDTLSRWVGGPDPQAMVGDFLNGYEAFRQGDFPSAIRMLRPLAEQGFATLQFLMGVMFGRTGQYAEAVKWYTLAADQSHARAQNNLGSMYEDGTGVPFPSIPKALELYGKAARQGLAEAQTNLGTIFATGALGPKAYVEAHAWFSVAAAQGDAMAVRARDHIGRRMNKVACSRAEARAKRYWKDYVLPFRNGAGSPSGQVELGCR